MFTMKVLYGTVVLCLILSVSGNEQEACSAQVIDLTSNNTYQLNEAVLEQILLREHVKDLPVVLVSVAGAFRGGKSFLINFFLRYLTAPEETRNQNGDWLARENDTVNRFSWRGGSQRHTKGIWMWSEPFIAVLPSGEKVAVLLMDTQGTFDSSSTVRDCSTIFALSTLLSSVQIYNLKENIRENDLQHLQLFTQYGRTIKNGTGTKAFQKLEFLVRDWPYEYELSYGQKGGEGLLADRLRVTEEMPAELRELREQIISSYETVTCFLMPHPGSNVQKRTFEGKLHELDEEFKDALKELVPSIFAPSNLTVKMINGEMVKARDLFTYFQTYTELFNSDKVPTVDTIAKMAARAALLAAVREARELYEARMERLVSAPQSVPSRALQDEHHRALQAAQATFLDKNTMASRNESDAYLARMSQELEDRLSEFVAINEGKLQTAVQEATGAYEAAIRRVHGENLLCLHPLDVEDEHNAAIHAALAIFDAKRKQYPGVQDPERVKLVEDLHSRLASLKNMNDQYNIMIVSSILMEFSTAMESALSSSSPLAEDEFAAKYREAKENAVAAFEAKRNKPSPHEDDPYKDSLTESMATQFSKLNTINSMNNRKSMEKAVDYYTSRMRMTWSPGYCCINPGDLLSEHNAAKELAFRLFHPNTKESDDFQKQLLAQTLRYRYYNMKQQNDDCNENAVRSALNRYIGYMDEKTKFDGWWLLVVPLIVHKSNMPGYHEDAKFYATRTFSDKQCDSHSSLYAHSYYWSLIDKIRRESSRYLD